MIAMNMAEYQQEAIVTRNRGVSPVEELLNYALGLGEAGELQNVVKKMVFHGHDKKEAQGMILDEAGDVLWYITMLLEVVGLKLEDAARHNVNKLRQRYPEGFSQEASRNRVM